MKIYVVTLEALKKKEIVDVTEFTTKIGGKTSLGPQLFCFINFIPHYILPYYDETGHSRPLIA